MEHGSGGLNHLPSAYLLNALAVCLLVTIGPIHAQHEQGHNDWQVGMGAGCRALPGLGMLPGPELTGFVRRSLGPRVDVRIGVDLSGHFDTIVDGSSSDGLLRAFPFLGHPDYKLLTASAGPTLWLGDLDSRWEPYVGGSLGWNRVYPVWREGLGAGFAGGLKHRLNNGPSLEFRAEAMVSRFRWKNPLTRPREHWGGSLALTAGVVLGR